MSNDLKKFIEMCVHFSDLVLSGLAVCKFFNALRFTAVGLIIIIFISFTSGLLFRMFVRQPTHSNTHTHMLWSKCHCFHSFIVDFGFRMCASSVPSVVMVCIWKELMLIWSIWKIVNGIFSHRIHVSLFCFHIRTQRHTGTQKLSTTTLILFWLLSAFDSVKQTFHQTLFQQTNILHKLMQSTSWR